MHILEKARLGFELKSASQSQHKVEVVNKDLLNYPNHLMCVDGRVIPHELIKVETMPRVYGIQWGEGLPVLAEYPSGARFSTRHFTEHLIYTMKTLNL